jgi:asparagine synthase (glutamine-hydrolysing)
MNEGWTKWIMRNTFSILPDAIRWRVDKIGYEPPQKAWMENPVVKERMTDSRDKLIQQHYLHASQANKSVTAVDAFEAGTTAWQQFMAGSMLSTK